MDAEAAPLRVFCGYDKREAIGFHVFVQSLLDRATIPVAIIPLSGDQRDGSNTFIYERFRVPELCGYQGKAIFLDGTDMLMRVDIKELAALFDPSKAVQVVKHDYKTTARRKYIGTEMEANNEDYPRKNWSSLILWNCAHPAHALLPPLAARSGAFLHQFKWLKDEDIGELPASWNVLIGEQDTTDCKIAHYTLGIPAMHHYRFDPYADEWFLAGVNMKRAPYQAVRKAA